MPLKNFRRIFYDADSGEAGGAATADSETAGTGDKTAINTHGEHDRQSWSNSDEAGAAEGNSSNGGQTPAGQGTGLLADAKGGDNGAAPDSENKGEDGNTQTGEKGQRPAHIAEQFWDAEKGVPKVDALSNSYNEIRKQNNNLLKQLSDKGQAPEDFNSYLEDFKPPTRARATGDQTEGQKLDRFGKMDATDPVFVAMAKAAKNANLSKGQFTDMLQDVMQDIHEILPEPFDAEKEKEILGEGAEQLIKTNRDWVDTLARNGVINEDQFKLLLGFGSTALGVELTNALRLNSGEKPIPRNLNGGANTGRKTPDECSAMMADERYHQEGPVGDAFRAEVDKAFAETYGTDPE